MARLNTRAPLLVHHGPGGLAGHFATGPGPTWDPRGIVGGSLRCPAHGTGAAGYGGPRDRFLAKAEKVGWGSAKSSPAGDGTRNHIYK